MLSTTQQMWRFAAIGALGFVVDGGVLTLLYNVAGIGLVKSRLASFALAVTVTWLLNRQATFHDRKDERAAREWGRYTVVQALGAAVNMAIFFALVGKFSGMAAMPLLPLAIASGVVMFLNFFLSKYIAFRKPRS